MALTPKGKELKDLDLDDLLSKLTDAELEELQSELIDPDDSMIPPSDRCRYKVDKEPTGPFSREKLLDYLENKAKNEKDWDESKPYSKEIRGKKYEPKEEVKPVVQDDVPLETEWDDVLAQATEEELVDLAAVLGFHGMLNQPQYHHAFVEGKELKGSGGFLGVAKYADFKIFPDEAPNSTDVEDSLRKVKGNDPTLKELNLNNVKGISVEQLCEFGEALRTNTSLEKLHMANTRSNDKVAKAIASGLLKNKTLKLLNLESNYISGTGIIELLEAINANQVVTEFRVVNQRPQILGVKNEMEIARLVHDNTSLLRFGIFMEVRGPRVQVTDSIKRNSDNLRRGRMGEEIVLPSVEETPSYLRDKSKAQESVEKNNSSVSYAAREEPVDDENEDE